MHCSNFLKRNARYNVYALDPDTGEKVRSNALTSSRKPHLSHTTPIPNQMHKKSYHLPIQNVHKGQKVFKARERSECCERQYCGSSRGFSIEVTTILSFTFFFFFFFSS